MAAGLGESSFVDIPRHASVRQRFSETVGGADAPGETPLHSAREHKAAISAWQTPYAGPRPRLSFRAVNARGSIGYDPGFQRHHLLPRQLLQKRCFGALIDEIGRERIGFDDFRANGLLLPASDAAAVRIGLPLHRGPHRDYNAMVIERVGQVEERWSAVRRRAPEVALAEAVERLRLLQRALRRRLLDPPRKHFALNRHDPLGKGTDFAELDAMVDALWPATWLAPGEANIEPAPIPSLALADAVVMLPVFRFARPASAAEAGLIEPRAGG